MNLSNETFALSSLTDADLDAVTGGDNPGMGPYDAPQRVEKVRPEDFGSDRGPGE